ncbi:hypothetical protein LMG28727_06865 [Paraburkholderia kirstenboschensis]|nr:hypothetical protein LMG28727_06865 [Paraburkholderia kirstenboschensis]
MERATLVMAVRHLCAAAEIAAQAGPQDFRSTRSSYSRSFVATTIQVSVRR